MIAVRVVAVVGIAEIAALRVREVVVHVVV